MSASEEVLCLHVTWAEFDRAVPSSSGHDGYASMLGRARALLSPADYARLRDYGRLYRIVPHLDPPAERFSFEPRYADGARALEPGFQRASLRRMDARQKFAAAAEGIAGLGYAPATRAAYLELVAPLAEEGPALQDEMGHMWSCALTVMGLWRKVGVRHELLDRKYEIEKAMAWVSLIGEGFGAEVYPGEGRLPGVGDAVEVNSGNHVVACVVRADIAVDDAGQRGGMVDTVEGGQADGAGNKCVERFAGKALRYVGGVLLLGNARVFRWYDCTKLGVPDDAVGETVDEERGPDTEPAPKPLGDADETHQP